MEQSLDLILMAILGGSGLYALYSILRLRKQMYPFPNRFLYPANCNPEDCRDIPGFIAFISWRYLVFGTLCIVLTALIGVCWFTDWLPLPFWLSTYVFPALGVLLFVWLIAIQSKTAKRFW